MTTKRNIKAKQLEIGQYIEKYYAAGEVESKTVPTAFKVTESQKNALKYIAKQKGMTPAELQRIGVELLLTYVDHVDALIENHDVILPVLERINPADS